VFFIESGKTVDEARVLSTRASGTDHADNRSLPSNEPLLLHGCVSHILVCAYVRAFGITVTAVDATITKMHPSLLLMIADRDALRL
jgi:hypothetical protein